MCAEVSGNAGLAELRASLSHYYGLEQGTVGRNGKREDGQNRKITARRKTGAQEAGLYMYGRLCLDGRLPVVMLGEHKNCMPSTPRPAFSVFLLNSAKQKTYPSPYLLSSTSTVSDIN